ncbi:MAG: glutamyl-tRNA reductase [Planctomycetales bacterium]|nr:glutamyl-tRNA reductase [Planctomycetales bacterium]
MKLQMVGCSHHNSSVQVRERLAFSPEQARQALVNLRRQFPDTEVVLLSTCNRVELYTAAQAPECCPTHHDMVNFLAEFHGLDAAEIFDDLFERTGEDTIRHLFTVAASLDSMVVGEAQILSQVKQAYELACEGNAAGTLLHAAFQAANRVAKRVTSETRIHQRRVSIPSVAVSDFAKQFFERFDDKKVLVIGAGEMGEETLRYLMDEGARDVTIVNRTLERSQQLVERTCGRALPWGCLSELLVSADLVISTTGATEPIVTAEQFREIETQRYQRALFILDLAIPRDFDAAINEFQNVYLYSIDDLAKVCDSNRRAREKEWPKAERIIEDETARFMADLYHRTTGPTIQRLKQRAGEIKDEELARLLNKLGDIEFRQQEEITRAFDRLVNKLLHPPLESLRDEAHSDSHPGLLDALKRLFQLKD